MDYFPSTVTGSSEGIPLTQIRTVKRGASSLAHPDLITFLAAAQKYNVEFVPVVWEEARGLLGRGGTADINQLMLRTHFPVDSSTYYDPLKNTPSKETSFAFKRTSQYHSGDGVTEGPSLYEILTMELVVLKQQPISDHPNIVDLEGISWEVTNNGQVYPVLLFEKGNWSDLSSFSGGLQGGYCTFNAKLGFCIDIAKALQVMHGLNIVHGDVKPQNVLLFDDEPNVERYTTSGSAKLTDFGYSCFGAQNSDVVSLPFSDIWSAPEYHDRGFELGEAKKVDVYSFGLTAVYLLFYWEVWDNFISPTVLEMRNYIKDGTMLRRIQEAIRVHYDNELQGASLSQFFSKTLAYKAGARETDMDSLIQLLRQAR